MRVADDDFGIESRSKQPMRWEQLLSNEESMIRIGILPIDTITWLDAPVSIAELRQRTIDIILVNPWLAGNFVKKPVNGETRWGIEYPSDLDSAHVSRLVDDKQLFHVVQKGNIDLHPDQPYDIQAEVCQQHPELRLKPSGEKDGGPVWKVTVIETADEQQVGLFMSLSHDAADGHTYYRLFGAVLGEDIPALRVRREFDTLDKQAGFLGKLESSVFFSAGFTFKMILGVLGQLFLGRWLPRYWRTTTKVVDVDPAKIAALKKQTSLPFVSTNDILTSWYLQHFTVGFMSINLRGRLDGHHDDLAGNYENFFYFHKADSTTPDLIRRALPTGRRVVTIGRPFSNWEAATKPVGTITNWSSFYPKYTKYQVHSHMPLLDLSYPPTVPMCIVCRVNDSRLSLFVLGTDSFFDRLDASMVSIVADRE